ncbi:MAG: AMP-binding protein [Afipia sp.]|nr:AMP-binding protein [Afipia sp.]
MNGPESAATSPTLDDLFRRTALRRPDALALVDPPNKQRISAQPPLRLTYAEADRAISGIAKQFVEAKLPRDSIVAVQLPNIVEFPIVVLAALRAGLTVALLPQLWRQSELTAALTRIGARAFVSLGRIELVDHGDLTMNAAAEVFSIRHVFGFGKNLPDGMTQLDIAAHRHDEFEPPPKLDSRQPAVVTFDALADGLCVVPRNHIQLIAGGLAVMLESGMSSEADILTTVTPASFGTFASSIVTWLLSGQSLTHHHPGDLQVLGQQIADPNHDVLIIPAPLALRYAEAQAFSARSKPTTVIGLWRTPERVASSELWVDPNAHFTDVMLFGEAGLIAAHRLPDGSPMPIDAGVQHAPRSAGQSRAVGELSLTPKGTLALRGVMVPVSAYHRPAHGAATLSEQPQQVDTGFGARLNRNTGNIEITSPPGGIFAVGGYRFLSRDLDEWSKRLSADTMLTALPDQLNGHRLAGRAQDAGRAREALGELGLNPLMVEAFRNRAEPA